MQFRRGSTGTGPRGVGGLGVRPVLQHANAGLAQRFPNKAKNLASAQVMRKPSERSSFLYLTIVTPSPPQVHWAGLLPLASSNRFAEEKKSP